MSKIRRALKLFAIRNFLCYNFYKGRKSVDTKYAIIISFLGKNMWKPD